MIKKEDQEVKVIQEGILTVQEILPRSDYYGVKFNWNRKQWIASINPLVQKHTKKFPSPLLVSTCEEACARAFNKEATRLFGDKAILNENIVETDKLLEHIKFTGIYHVPKKTAYRVDVYYRSESLLIGHFKTKAIAVLIYNNVVRTLWGYHTKRTHKLDGKEI